MQLSLETENELKRLKLVPRKMFSNEHPGAGSNPATKLSTHAPILLMTSADYPYRCTMVTVAVVDRARTCASPESLIIMLATTMAETTESYRGFKSALKSMTRTNSM
jgi:hypothetical protein